ncbi:MAG TPA: ATP-binding protein, partial [Allocoleopsis sp.]
GQNTVEELAHKLMNQAANRVQDHLNTSLQTPQNTIAVNYNAFQEGRLNIKDFEKMRQHLWLQINLTPSLTITSYINEQGKQIGYGRVISQEFVELAKKLTAEKNLKIGTLFLYQVSSTQQKRQDQYLINKDGLPRKHTYSVPVDHTKAPWYLQAKTAKKQIWSDIHVSKIAPSLTINAAFPIFDKTGNFQGVFNSSLMLSDISTFLNKLNVSQSGQTFIMERSGNLVATSTLELPFVNNGKKPPSRLRVNDSQNLWTRAIASQLQQQYKDFSKIPPDLHFKVTVKQNILFVQVVPYKNQYGPDWLQVTAIPESEFMKQINENTKNTILLCLLTLGITTGLGVIAANFITHPIWRLNQASEAIANGEFHQVLEVKGISEIETLAASFNLMVQQLNTSFETLENRVEERTTELVLAKEKAEIANQAKSAFIANMSHELRTPLNAILGFSQIMLRSQILPPEYQENSSIIYESGEYLLTLINNILDLAKIESGKITLNSKNFDLYALLYEVEDLLHLKAEQKGLQLIFDGADDVPKYIFTDETKLKQVLINILNNAIKFTEHGGVSLRMRSLNREKFNLNKEGEDEIITFEIEDTGVGIAANELDQLFTAFGQTESGKNTQEGTGLGLAISKQFVQLMGGDITVKSQVGSGTIFTFNIPVIICNAETVEMPKFARQVIALKPGQPEYKILIVDDRPTNRLLLIKLLQPLGFQLKEAGNGQEAIEIWEQWQPHLIFMDMRMPIKDGYEATQYIKSTTKGNATAIIAVTASVLEEEKAVVLSAGCDDFIRKPFKESTIFDTLKKHLGLQYIYAEENQNQTIMKNAHLTPEDLIKMPKEWLKELLQASVNLDDEYILELIKQIPEDNSLLCEKFTYLVNNFQLHKIREIIEKILN